MTTVKCPICGEPVAGEGSEQLTTGMQEHLVQVHEMNDLEACPAVGPAGELDTPKDRSAVGNVPERCLEGPAGELDTPKRATVVGVSVSGSYLRTGPAGELDTPKGRMNERSLSLSEEERREGSNLLMLEMTCPMCTSMVSGSGDEGLSNALKHHMKEVHGI